VEKQQRKQRALLLPAERNVLPSVRHLKWSEEAKFHSALGQPYRYPSFTARPGSP
jgi:hypothetical protein